MSGSAEAVWRWIAAEQVAAFVYDVLMSSTRRRPIVAITTNPRTGELTLSGEWLARELGEAADVVAFATGDATWALSDAMPGRLDVYGGSARIWWPGLARSSDPYAHPLIFFMADQADATAQRIVDTVRVRAIGSTRSGARSGGLPAAAELPARTPEPPPSLPVPGGVTKAGRPVLRATITSIDHGRIRLRVGDERGVLAFADEKLVDLAARLAVGDDVPVFVVSVGPRGQQYSTQGLLPPRPDAASAMGTATRTTLGPSVPTRAPTQRGPLRVDPWLRLDEEYRVGDVVRGRVCEIRERSVLIELLPGATLICPIGELDQGFVHHPDDVVELGQRVNVELLSLDVERRRGEVSIRGAGWSEPLAAISPGPGQPPFLGDEELAREVDDGEAARRAEQLTVELENANADRADLRKRLKGANDQAVALRKELRSAEDSLRALEARSLGDLDPLSSETAFLTAVRVEYARRVNESDRVEYPLLRMRVGREFLEHVRALDGIAVDKVVEVCAQVACGRAHEIVAREVHELRAGEGGSPARVRERDGAKAWRCALQINTASARRLHWWEIPGKDPRFADGRIVELASVAVHDDVSIP